jgi:hypothetical protein
MIKHRLLFAALWLLLVPACGPPPPSTTTTTSTQSADQVARQSVERQLPPGALERALVEVRSSQPGWLVVFHDVNISCEQVRWPEACGMPSPRTPATAPFIYRDLWVCVDSQAWQVSHLGGGPQPVGDQDLCESGPRPIQPTALAPA